MNIAIGLLIPFLGTLLGAACVYLIKDKLSEIFRKILLGFASGVMVAASVWSLLIPSLDMNADAKPWTWVPAVVGLFLGMAFLFLLDSIIPHLHTSSVEPEGIESSLKRTTMLVLAITLHNIPEGMAIGVVLASAISDSASVSLSGALALSIGIAIQNFPEGAIVAMPLRTEGASKNKAFLLASCSGFVEPIAALFTILIIDFVMTFLPYLLAFAAGAMLYVVVEELIPESQDGQHSNIATIGFAFGFALMMILDTSL